MGAPKSHSNHPKKLVRFYQTLRGTIGELHDVWSIREERKSAGIYEENLDLDFIPQERVFTELTPEEIRREEALDPYMFCHITLPGIEKDPSFADFCRKLEIAIPGYLAEIGRG
jgi:hypothetical protein